MKIKPIKIGNRLVGNAYPCYTIAEMIGYPTFTTSDCLMATMFAREGLKTLGVGRDVRVDEFSIGKIFQ